MDCTVPWSASMADIDHRSYNLSARPVSQPIVGQPRPIAQVMQACADVKPRLTKDQHEILERHFQQQPKPTTLVKKGFADSLGVPLDKINNWFQNRRAKVKQDAKKQLNAYNLFQAHLANPQNYLSHTSQAPGGVPFHHGPLPVVPSNSEPVQDTSSQVSMVPHASAPMQLSAQETFYAPTADFAVQAPTTASESILSDGQIYPNHIRGEPMLLQEFSFGPSFGQDFSCESFNLFMQPSGMNAVPVGSMPTMQDMYTPPQSNSASPNTMPQLTAAYNPAGQAEDLSLHQETGSPSELADYPANTGHPTPAESVSAPSASVHGSDSFESPSASAPIFTLHEDSPPVESIERRDSSALTDSTNGVGIDASSPESESSFKAPSQTSGLAARRQKPRPANLIATALRSASYSAGMPGSPGANVNSGAQDQLRRIRSHGIVNPGRVSKPSAPQKSPMHATFDAAAIASPKFAKHASNFSMSSVSTGPLTATTVPGSLAPPTPLTPLEFSRFPNSQAPGMYYQNGSPAYSHAGEDLMYFDTSSPLSKLDMQQMDQYRASVLARQEASLFHTPPQSAPAMQQHFGLTPPSFSGGQMMQAPFQGHMRKVSLPESNHGSTAHWKPQITSQPQHDPQVPLPPQLSEAFQANTDEYQNLSTFGGEMPDMSMPFGAPQHIKISTNMSALPIHFHNSGPQDYQAQHK